MKTSKDYLSEANSVVEKISVSEGIEKHESGSTLFIDVRDSADIAQTGTISNCLRIPRGMIEFVADASSPLHNQSLTKDQKKTSLRPDPWMIWLPVGGEALLEVRAFRRDG